MANRELKIYKLARQDQAAEDEAIRQDLDEDMDELRSLLFTKEARDSSNANLIPIQPNSRYQIKPDKDDDYDMNLNILANDKKAAPTDRTLTAEEQALKDKEELEEAERLRMARMLGEEEESQPKLAGWKKRRQLMAAQRAGRSKTDDAEEIDDGEEIWEGLGQGTLASTTLSDDDMQDEEADTDDSAEGSSEDDQENGSADEGESAEEDTTESDPILSHHGKHVNLMKKRPRAAKAVVSSLPFTFSMPEDHDEFLEILEPHASNDLHTIVERIRKLHHPSLGEGNKERLANFCTILLDHYIYLASEEQIDFAALNVLSHHIFSLATLDTVGFAEFNRQKLGLLQSNLANGLRQPDEPGSRIWPGPEEMLLLRLLSKIWSTSDRFHAVAGPMYLLLGTYLGQARIRSLQDIFSALFICGIWLDSEELSNRIVPEILSTLFNAIVRLCPLDMPLPKRCHYSTLDGRNPGTSKLCLSKKRDYSQCAVGTAHFETFCEEELQDVEEAKINLLALALRLSSHAARIYQSSPTFVDMFTPFVDFMVQPLGIALLEVCAAAFHLEGYETDIWTGRVEYICNTTQRRCGAGKEGSRGADVTDTETDGDPFTHAQVRGRLLARQTLRPGPRAVGAREAQGRAQGGAEERDSGAATGRLVPRRRATAAAGARERGLREQDAERDRERLCRMGGREEMGEGQGGAQAPSQEPWLSVWLSISHACMAVRQF